MKVLTVCERGLNRSVTAQYLLQRDQHEVISAGILTLSDETMQLLYDWADKVVLLDGRYRDQIPAEKLVLWDVGPDIFDHHFNIDLVRILRTLKQGRAL
jgi:predicted protein tyrosine phosphatase